jgi:hypothetical protein
MQHHHAFVTYFYVTVTYTPLLFIILNTVIFRKHLPSDIAF